MSNLSFAEKPAVRIVATHASDRFMFDGGKGFELSDLFRVRYGISSS